MDQLTSMAVFVKCVEGGSLAAAARHFGLSNAMVGKHIHGLEQRLGARLLNLTTRHLSLTQVGQTYHLRCQQILADVAEADAEAGTLQTAPRGTLRVSAPLNLGELHLGPIIADFMRTYPEIEVDAELSDRYVHLLDEGVDVAIRVGRLGDSGLVARRLGSSAMMACAAPAYLRRRGTPAHPDELVGHECFTFSLAAQPEVWWFDGQHGKELAVNVRGRLRATSMKLLASVASAGLGIVFGPGFALAPWIDNGVLVPVLQQYPSRPLEIHALYPGRRHLSSKVRLFIDFLAPRFAAAAWNELRAGVA
ncbi:LysR family transcriptional regulator [Duganella callida]|uniref:LysR family transcriptional regulator n=1 Tax=Duganella callida TaxID=2561932 RepID=A0A4Y9SRY8_9BURK|nr:LysR family transcriptional regulator [Duganella callida]TFW28099.1 LysR family transcriptional regulator [Duganella callida]